MAAPATTSAASDELATLRAQHDAMARGLALKEALADAGVTDSRHKKAIESLYNAAKVDTSILEGNTTVEL